MSRPNEPPGANGAMGFCVVSRGIGNTMGQRPKVGKPVQYSPSGHLRYANRGPNSRLVFTYRLIVAVHIFADMIWLGSIATVGALIAQRDTKHLQARGLAARWAYIRLSVPAFAIAFIAGGACLLADPSHALLRLPSMHAKLTLAAGVIGLHHWIGGAARRIADGSRQVPISPLPPVLLLAAACGAALLGVLKPF